VSGIIGMVALLDRIQGATPGLLLLERPFEGVNLWWSHAFAAPSHLP
jgi:hypothetical protein